ncbi:hypothetical protein HYX58_00065 [Candidatus Dependentiae bacterium]|nr:hypothetical protein [Candidatus Dependentiae bacterium]
MARPRSKIEVVCQNYPCKYYRRENNKNITKSGVYKTGHQRYYCHHCETYFMETKGTPLYRKHMSEEEIILICKHLVEKNGIRSIERITGHHRDTIGNLLTDIGEHAKSMNEYLIKKLKLTPMECDEFWAFVKKSKRKLTPKAEIALRLVVHMDTLV